MITRPISVGPSWLAGVLLMVAACTPSVAPTPASAGPTQEPLRPELVVGCVGIDRAECRFVAEQVVAVLPAERGPAFTVQIELSGCANDGPCPRTLAVREGRAIVDFTDGGDPIQLSLAGPPPAPRIAVVRGFWSGLIRPASPRVAGFGPFPFELGHCGLTHIVDFDGSFWVPTGQVDDGAPGIINAESGQMLLLAPNLARYQGAGGSPPSSFASPARSTSRSAPDVEPGAPADPQRRPMNRTRVGSISAQTSADPGHGVNPPSAAIASAGCAGYADAS